MMLLWASLVLTSCLKSGDEELTFYDDAGIVSFSLGTLNCYQHTLSTNGADSTYLTKITGSSYKFYINQATREIYNPDSLPYGTDAAHVVCTVGTKNSGVVAVKSVVGDTLRWHSSSDSIDFTQPREFVVFSSSDAAQARYTVRVNVHQQKADTFSWSEASRSDLFASLTGMKAVAVGTEVLLFGTNGAETLVFGRGDNGWEQLTLSIGSLDAEAWKNVVVRGDSVIVKNGGELLCRKAQGDWMKLADTDVRQLVAASSLHLFAISADGLLVSSADEGRTWNVEPLDDDAALLPTQDISYTCTRVRTNDDVERVVLVGNRSESAYPNDANAVVWSKIEDGNDGSVEHSWSYSTVNSGSRFPLKRLRGLTVANYGEGMVALGGSGFGGSTAAPFASLYESRDGGIAWRTRDYLPLPSGFQSTDGVFAITSDADNYLWIVCGGTGQVWRGRLNRLGWTTEQTSFTK